MSTLSRDELQDVLRRRFQDRFGAAPRLALAPGRVNLIGEHTDYNDGFVMPMAIDREIVVAFGERSDGQIVAHATDFDLELTILTGDPDLNAYPHWMRYVAAVARAVRERAPLGGANLVIAGNVPVGAGLSSSAALGVALARAFTELAERAWDPVEAAMLVQSAEFEATGVRCGIMDPYASAAARAGSAIWLDCRSLQARYVPIPREAAFVVMDTATRRTLASSAYNERRAACERAVAAIRESDPSVTALRDVQPEQLAGARGRMDVEAYMRASHVIEENGRVLAFAEVLASGNLDRAGALMDASHASLRELYQVSSAELNLITEIARATPGCFGARMTGAGFGGCAVALVDAARVAEWAPEVENQYRVRSGKPGTLLHVIPSDGAHVVD
ncbi:MAG TPA: galactokinase [Gemmatimonadaceae bacterium]|nr:galactokinase [Gemmatimonadaceae bacterium]